MSQSSYYNDFYKELSVIDNQYNLIDKIEPMLPDLKTKSRVLDIGCGHGAIAKALLGRGFDVSGVEINQEALSSLRAAGINAIEKDISQPFSLDKQYDLILLLDVLEHVFDQADVLKEVDRILKDNGTFLVTVPWDFIMGPFFLLFNLNCLYMGYVKGSIYHKYRCGHIHHFTKSRLKEVLAQNGFVLDKVFVVNGLLLYASARKQTLKSK